MQLDTANVSKVSQTRLATSHFRGTWRRRACDRSWSKSSSDNVTENSGFDFMNHLLLAFDAIRVPTWTNEDDSQKVEALSIGVRGRRRVGDQPAIDSFASLVPCHQRRGGFEGCDKTSGSVSSRMVFRAIGHQLTAAKAPNAWVAHTMTASILYQPEALARGPTNGPSLALRAGMARAQPNC
jgi:hypothetical protein